MMQRHPSLESQYSAMHQQFVPSQSHQIEDIVSVSTLSIDNGKSETVLPLEKHSSNEAMSWGRPSEVNAAVVSAQIRERAVKKKVMIGGGDSHEQLPEKRVDHVNTSSREGQTSMGEQKYSGKVDIAALSAQDRAMGVKKKKPSVSGISLLGGLQAKCEEGVNTITKDVETSEGDHQFPGANVSHQQTASWGGTQEGNDIAQGIPQGEHPLIDEKSTLLDFPEPKTTQSEDSNVVGFFRKIQSFLFSPNPFKQKRSDESESSCCESDFDSEFSEITSGSFNPGEIEAMREELENLLLSSSPAPDSFHEPNVAAGSEDKPLIEFEIGGIEGLGKGKKDNEIPREDNLERNLGDTNGSDKLKTSNEHSEASGIKKWNNDGANMQAEDIDCEKQQEASGGTECQIRGWKGEVDSFPMEAGVDSHESGKDPANNDSSIYTTTSVVKVQKETTV